MNRTVGVLWLASCASFACGDSRSYRNVADSTGGTSAASFMARRAAGFGVDSLPRIPTAPGHHRARILLGADCLLDGRQEAGRWVVTEVIRMDAPTQARVRIIANDSVDWQMRDFLRVVSSIPGVPPRRRGIDIDALGALLIATQDTTGYAEWVYDDPDIHGAAPDRALIIAYRRLATAMGLSASCQPRKEFSEGGSL